MSNASKVGLRLLPLLLLAPGLASGAPWEGRWVDNRSCARTPESEDCLAEHLFETSFRGERLIGSYLRTSERFKQNKVGDGAAWFSAAVRGTALSGNKTSYFPLSSSGDCGQMKGSVSVRGELSGDGATLTLTYSRQRIRTSSCTIEDTEPDTRTYYRVGPPPETPAPSAADVAALGELPVLPVIDPAQCDTWVALRDGPLASGMEEIVSVHESFETLGQLEKTQAALAANRELVALLRADRDQVADAGKVDAVARSIDALASQTLDLLAAVRPEVKLPNWGLKAVRCMTLVVNGAIGDNDGHSGQRLEAELGGCLETMAEEMVGEAIGPRYGPALNSVWTMGKLSKALINSREKYGALLDSFDDALARSALELGRLQQARDAAMDAAMEFQRSNDLVQHIDAVCGE